MENLDRSQQTGIFLLSEVEKVSSTNDVVKLAIDEGRPEGFAVRADAQSGGYGRHGRFWSSPRGGVYMSALLRPADHLGCGEEFYAKLPTLSLLVGLAVRSALDEICGGDADICVKWPNDVVVRDGDASMEGIRGCAMFEKICGISLEQYRGAICVGMGINVFRPSDVSAESLDAKEGDQIIRNRPAYLEDIASLKGLNRADALSYVSSETLRSLDSYYRKWLDLPFGAFVDEYNRFCLLEGRSVRIELNDGSVEAEGNVVGVNGRGQLEVLDRLKGLVPVSSGEAHVIM